MDTLGKILHVKFLGYAHWFMSIIISQMKDHSSSVDQARYATSIVATYLDTATFKLSTTFYETTLPADMIFTKEYLYASDEQAKNLSSKFSINYSVKIHESSQCDSRPNDSPTSRSNQSINLTNTL